jgi:hypothetical protein
MIVGIRRENQEEAQDWSYRLASETLSGKFQVLCTSAFVPRRKQGAQPS